jgi:hypothetical protein
MPDFASAASGWQRSWWLSLFVFLFAAQSALGITIGLPVEVGTNNNSALHEVSGLVDSRAHPNTLWVHNDSGNPASLYAISTGGVLLGTFPIAGTTNRDWEDIAVGPKPDGGNYLYLGDIGDNTGVRSAITVHRIVEPLSTEGATIPLGSYASVNLKYPGGPRDAEALLADPISGELFVITKRTLIPEIYSFPSSVFDSPGQTVVMTPRENLGGPLRFVMEGVSIRQANSMGIRLPQLIHIRSRRRHRCCRVITTAIALWTLPTLRCGATNLDRILRCRMKSTLPTR